jgi:hypothetical protein
MNRITQIFKIIKFNNLNYRVRTGFALVIISLVTNHLTENDNFTFNSSYSFPLFSIITSIIIGTLVLIIADLNFKHFKEKHFTYKIIPEIIIRFLISTLGYISIIYIPIYFIIVWLKGGDYEFYYFLIGLTITLLLSSLGVILIFAKEIYKLHKLETINGKINFRKGGETFLINYSEISYVHSENKIVKIVKTDGKWLVTDLTLNEVEATINEHLFFKANRQTIIHYQSIENSKSIENGKLLVSLKPTISEKDNHQINISRYKKKEFKEWLERKL